MESYKQAGKRARSKKVVDIEERVLDWVYYVQYTLTPGLLLGSRPKRKLAVLQTPHSAGGLTEAV